MKERPSEDKNMLELDAHYESFTPAEMFEYWTKPELLAQWDADHSQVEAKLGGRYVKHFTEYGWTVTGEFTLFNPPNHLAFTWMWDQKPNAPETHVDVTFTAPEGGGTRVVLRQGPFGDAPDDLELQQVITEGWVHFGMRLAGLRAGGAQIEPGTG